MKIKNHDLIEEAGGPVSLATSTVLPPVYVGEAYNYSIQLVFTGTPGGSFSLQASNDTGSIDATHPDVSTHGVMNWTDVQDSPVTVAAAGDLMYDVRIAGYNYVRVIYTRTSGTGTITVARAYVKGLEGGL